MVINPTRRFEGRAPKLAAYAASEHLLGAVGANDAVLGKHRIDDRILDGERCGMRSRRLGTDLRSTGLGQEHALAAGPYGVEGGEKGIAVLHPLRVGRHHPNLRAVRHPGDTLGQRDVALVAGGHPEPDCDAAPACKQTEVRPVRAALTHDGDRAGPGAIDVEGGGEGREESGRGVVHAKTVGSQDAHAARSRDLAHAALPDRALRIHLGEARSEHDGRAHPALGALLDGLEGHRGRNRHDGDIDRAGHPGDIRPRLDSLHPVATRVDRPDLAPESGLLQVAQRPPADPVRVFRGADDGYGARIEESVQP